MIIKITDLPQDVLVLIAKKLNLHSLKNLSLLNKLMKSVAWHDNIWQAIYKNHFTDHAQPSSDFYHAFTKSSSMEYSSAKDAELFYFAKEGSSTEIVSSLLLEPKLLDGYLENVDIKHLTPVDWLIAKKHKPVLKDLFTHVLNHCFTAKDIKTVALEQDERGFSPIHWAVLCDQDEAVVSLYCNLQPMRFKISPMHIAAKYGLPHMIRHLHSLGLKLDIATNYPKSSKKIVHTHQTPFHYAAQKGYLDCLEVLFELKADAKQTMTILHKNHDPQVGITPLHIAAENNQEKAALLLIKKGHLSPLSMDSSGKSPISIAIEKDYISLFEKMMDKLQNSDDEKNLLNRILFEAACKNKHEYIGSLLEKGADPYWKNPSPIYLYHSRNAIEIAAVNEHQEAIKVLSFGKNPRQGISVRGGGHQGLAFVIGLIIGILLSTFSLLLLTYIAASNDFVFDSLWEVAIVVMADFLVVTLGTAITATMLTRCYQNSINKKAELFLNNQGDSNNDHNVPDIEIAITPSPSPKEEEEPLLDSRRNETTQDTQNYLKFMLLTKGSAEFVQDKKESSDRWDYSILKMS